jgi:hypothetical protein
MACFDWLRNSDYTPEFRSPVAFELCPIFFDKFFGTTPPRIEPDYPVVWIDQTGTGDGGSSTKEFIKEYGAQFKGYWAPKFGRVIAIP